MLSSPSFDAATIDPLSVEAGDPQTGVRSAPLRSTLEDVNSDGLQDLVLHFSMRQLTGSGALTEETAVLGIDALVGPNTLAVGYDFVEIVP